MSEDSNDLRTASAIIFDQATKMYPGQADPALDALDLNVEAGELVCLVGPSGGGKTTALMLVNRLVELSSGDIRLGEKSIGSLDAIQLRREIGYVIQQTGLFPHMTVADNIGLVPQILGWKKSSIRNRVHELLELVGLTPTVDIAKRYPGQLSGGQQQRVGIVRALAANPPVMLMDEPFGALDPITRTRVQDEFLALHNEIGKTTLFVTHDIDEAIKMSNRIAILKPGGKLAQFDTPDAVLSRPADDFVEEFVGEDRGLKRLSLIAVRKLVNPSTELPAETETASRRWPRIEQDKGARTALSLVLAAETEGVVVTDGGGVAVGTVTLKELASIAGSGNDALAGSATP